MTLRFSSQIPARALLRTVWLKEGKLDATVFAALSHTEHLLFRAVHEKLLRGTY